MTLAASSVGRSQPIVEIQTSLRHPAKEVPQGNATCSRKTTNPSDAFLRKVYEAGITDKSGRILSLQGEWPALLDDQIEKLEKFLGKSREAKSREGDDTLFYYTLSDYLEELPNWISASQGAEYRAILQDTHIIGMMVYEFVILRPYIISCLADSLNIPEAENLITDDLIASSFVKALDTDLKTLITFVGDVKPDCPRWLNSALASINESIPYALGCVAYDNPDLKNKTSPSIDVLIQKGIHKCPRGGAVVDPMKSKAFTMVSFGDGGSDEVDHSLVFSSKRSWQFPSNSITLKRHCGGKKACWTLESPAIPGMNKFQGLFDFLGKKGRLVTDDADEFLWPKFLGLLVKGYTGAGTIDDEKEIIEIACSSPGMRHYVLQHWITNHCSDADTAVLFIIQALATMSSYGMKAGYDDDIRGYIHYIYANEKLQKKPLSKHVLPIVDLLGKESKVDFLQVWAFLNIVADMATEDSKGGVVERDDHLGKPARGLYFSGFHKGPCLLISGRTDHEILAPLLESLEDSISLPEQTSKAMLSVIKNIAPGHLGAIDEMVTIPNLLLAWSRLERTSEQSAFHIVSTLADKGILEAIKEMRSRWPETFVDIIKRKHIQDALSKKELEDFLISIALHSDPVVAKTFLTQIIHFPQKSCQKVFQTMKEQSPDRALALLADSSFRELLGLTMLVETLSWLVGERNIPVNESPAKDLIETLFIDVKRGVKALQKHQSSLRLLKLSRTLTVEPAKRFWLDARLALCDLLSPEKPYPKALMAHWKMYLEGSDDFLQKRKVMEILDRFHNRETSKEGLTLLVDLMKNSQCKTLEIWLAVFRAISKSRPDLGEKLIESFCSSYQPQEVFTDQKFDYGSGILDTCKNVNRLPDIAIEQMLQGRGILPKILSEKSAFAVFDKLFRQLGLRFFEKKYNPDRIARVMRNYPVRKRLYFLHSIPLDNLNHHAPLIRLIGKQLFPSAEIAMKCLPQPPLQPEFRQRMISLAKHFDQYEESIILDFLFIDDVHHQKWDSLVGREEAVVNPRMFFGNISLEHARSRVEAMKNALLGDSINVDVKGPLFTLLIHTWDTYLPYSPKLFNEFCELNLKRTVRFVLKKHPFHLEKTMIESLLVILAAKDHWQYQRLYNHVESVLTNKEVIDMSIVLASNFGEKVRELLSRMNQHFWMNPEVANRTLVSYGRITQRTCDLMELSKNLPVEQGSELMFALMRCLVKTGKYHSLTDQLLNAVISYNSVQNDNRLREILHTLFDRLHNKKCDISLAEKAFYLMSQSNWESPLEWTLLRKAMRTLAEDSKAQKITTALYSHIKNIPRDNQLAEDWLQILRNARQLPQQLLQDFWENNSPLLPLLSEDDLVEATFMMWIATLKWFDIKNFTNDEEATAWAIERYRQRISQNSLLGKVAQKRRLTLDIELIRTFLKIPSRTSMLQAVLVLCQLIPENISNSDLIDTLKALVSALLDFGDESLLKKVIERIVFMARFVILTIPQKITLLSALYGCEGADEMQCCLKLLNDTLNDIRKQSRGRNANIDNISVSILSDAFRKLSTSHNRKIRMRAFEIWREHRLNRDFPTVIFDNDLERNFDCYHIKAAIEGGDLDAIQKIINFNRHYLKDVYKGLHENIRRNNSVKKRYRHCRKPTEENRHIVQMLSYYFSRGCHQTDEYSSSTFMMEQWRKNNMPMRTDEYIAISQQGVQYLISSDFTPLNERSRKLRFDVIIDILNNILREGGTKSLLPIADSVVAFFKTELNNCWFEDSVRRLEAFLKSLS